MRHEPSESSRSSSDDGGAGLLARVLVIAWAAVVYAAYWLRYLPAGR